MMEKAERRFLTSKEEIMEFLGVKDSAFSTFLKLQMPAVRINGRWYAHAKNIDDWCMRLTAKQLPPIEDAGVDLS